MLSHTHSPLQSDEDADDLTLASSEAGAIKSDAPSTTTTGSGETQAHETIQLPPSENKFIVMLSHLSTGQALVAWLLLRKRRLAGI